jgi:ferritin
VSNYNATLTLNFTKEEFYEHCIEYGVEPCMTQLRSWLMQRAVDGDLNALQISRAATKS